MRDGILKREIKRKGGVNAVSRALGVSTSAVYYWLNGQREPSEALLRYLGLERKVRFVRTLEAGDAH